MLFNGSSNVGSQLSFSSPFHNTQALGSLLRDRLRVEGAFGHCVRGARGCSGLLVRSGRGGNCCRDRFLSIGDSTSSGAPEERGKYPKPSSCHKQRAGELRYPPIWTRVPLALYFLLFGSNRLAAWLLNLDRKRPFRGVLPCYVPTTIFLAASGLWSPREPPVVESGGCDAGSAAAAPHRATKRSRSSSKRTIILLVQFR